MRRKRLAIISSYDEGCGNASYSHALKLGFQEHVDTEVLALDLNLLQKRGTFIRKMADTHINELASFLRHYDYVNIQFEAGLYGRRQSEILRRFHALANAAPNLIVTMHRIDPVTALRDVWPYRAAVSAISKKYRREQRNNAYALLYKDIIDHCEKLRHHKNVWLCVHTKREQRLVTQIYGNKNCFDFPLAFLLPDVRQSVLQTSDRDAFKLKHGFGKHQKVLGVFGFLGSYKGIETAIRALSLLPREYVLGIFGGQHPQSIEPHKEIDEYMRFIIEMIGYGPNFSPGAMSLTPKRKGKRDEVSENCAEFGDRIRFIGSLSDPDFIEALRCCDGALLPYREVGQSMSGVLPLAIEAKARLFYSNNRSFLESARYFGNVGETFDIGNFVELAQKVRYSERNFDDVQERSYQKYNIRELVRIYLRHFDDRPIGQAAVPGHGQRFEVPSGNA